MLLMASVLSFSEMAQAQVWTIAQLPEKGIRGESVAYRLPTTTFKMTVSVSKMQEVRGYFADYAESLLGLTNIISQNRTYYKLNSIDIEPIRTMDLHSDYYYAVSSNENVIADWNAQRLAAPDFCTGMSATSYQSHTTSLPDFFKNYADISYTQQSEAFVDTKIIDGVVTQVPASHTKTVSKSFENKAREAADAIVKCRKDQYNLAAGEQETPYTGEAIATMLSELKNWENNYMSLFTGITVEDSMTYVFYVTPPDLKPVTAFYFDPKTGLNLSGGTESAAYSLKFDRFYSVSTTDVPSFPMSGYLSKCLKPVRVHLTHQNADIHDFGIVNMYQAGTLVHVLYNSKNPVSISTAGFIF